LHIFWRAIADVVQQQLMPIRLMISIPTKAMLLSCRLIMCNLKTIFCGKISEERRPDHPGVKKEWTNFGKTMIN
uniref:Ovule protein n=1 Tax=Globodera pallida TaxID=36090 RepID=A0A183CCD8_GLOPA